MSDDEVHDLRMAVGQSVLTFNDILDDELIALLRETHQAMERAVTELRSRGIERPFVMGMLLNSSVRVVEDSYAKDDQ